MIYDKISKGEDGLYYVRAFTDERKRCFIQLDNVTVKEVDDSEITFEGDLAPVDNIHDTNIQNAITYSEDWFGKKLQEKTLKTAYTKDDCLTTDRISSTRVYDHDKTLLDGDKVEAGEVVSVIVEFAGLWFAKKAFGPRWNVVQVRKSQPEEEEEKFDESYPDDYMFQ